MRNSVILCIHFLSSAANSAPAGGDVPCALAAPENKDAVITELLCVEDHNKRMVLERNNYESLRRAINGQDGSDCLAIRCINPGELSIELHTKPEAVDFTVEFGDGQKHYVTSAGAQPIPLEAWRGIIAPVPRSIPYPDSCQRNSMSYIDITNDGRQAVALATVKLVLRFTDGLSKTIFADTQTRTLEPDRSVVFQRQQLLDNAAFQRAKEGSCFDN